MKRTKCKFCHGPIPKRKQSYHAKTCSASCKSALAGRKRKPPSDLKQSRPSYARMMRSYNSLDAGYAHSYAESDYPSTIIR